MSGEGGRRLEYNEANKKEAKIESGAWEGGESRGRDHLGRAHQGRPRKEQKRERERKDSNERLERVCGDPSVEVDDLSESSSYVGFFCVMPPPDPPDPPAFLLDLLLL